MRIALVLAVGGLTLSTGCRSRCDSCNAPPVAYPAPYGVGQQGTPVVRTPTYHQNTAIAQQPTYAAPAGETADAARQALAAVPDYRPPTYAAAPNADPTGGVPAMPPAMTTPPQVAGERGSLPR